jgi:hypothetical protein
MDSENNYVEKPLPGADPLETPLERVVRLGADDIEALLDRDDFYDAISKDRKSFPPAIIRKKG